MINLDYTKNTKINIIEEPEYKNTDIINNLNYKEIESIYDIDVEVNRTLDQLFSEDDIEVIEINEEAVLEINDLLNNLIK
jgi:hypothetical protein